MTAKTFTTGLENGAACAIVVMDVILKWKDYGFDYTIAADTEMSMHGCALESFRVSKRFRLVS